ncbi:hypothetical protein [Rhizobium rhizogenes]|uniref:PH domain-containing protein n=2 Tax=Rhizobium rhizogenes TaxID=359 RepID=A0AA87Q6Q2_RHIRH|nr:hypothetical protein [Rhizobium rhizogenes]MDJ1638235.1 hypothetical protein [Rhizobium rhizogenes]NTG75396.1 hypothetical protein [Rhizobium rhizogenes]TQO75633.1 hypothetical protein FFE80_22770 [Rhizobium rhizogenes]GAJ92587.1 hypothetical protein RRH01S_04_01400 [Rhizobium rhizogenes NBRC 13257]
MGVKTWSSARSVMANIVLWPGKHSEGPSLDTDTTSVRDIRYSRSSFRIVIAIYCLLAVGLAAMLIGAGVGRFYTIIGLLPLALFIAFILYEYFRRDFLTPVITIGPQGIQDIRIAAGFIPWECMDGVIFAGLDPRMAKTATIFLNPESKTVLSADLVAKFWKGSKRSRPRPVLINRGQFDTRFKEITAAIDLYYRVYKARARNAEIARQQHTPA